jgi:GNAT superfamily N-acetyltransferase
VIDVRPATPDDAERLAELRWEFRVARAPATEDRDAFIRRCALWMRDELASAVRWRAWAAVADDTIVGQLWIQTIAKMPNPVAEREAHGYVSNVFVQPAFRGGAGLRLLEAALAWARTQNYDRLILWPSPPSVSLYERFGFTHRGDVMELSIGSTRQSSAESRRARPPAPPDPSSAA